MPSQNVVRFHVILVLVFLLDECSDMLFGTNGVCPICRDSRNLYLPVLAGKVAWNVEDKFGNAVIRAVVSGDLSAAHVLESER